MKWFKHMTDASTDEKLVEIHDEWGMWGLGVWWDLVSRVAARYNVNEQPVACLNVKELCQYYSKTRRKLAEYLLHIERLRLGRAMAEYVLGLFIARIRAEQPLRRSERASLPPYQSGKVGRCIRDSHRLFFPRTEGGPGRSCRTR